MVQNLSPLIWRNALDMALQWPHFSDALRSGLLAARLSKHLPLSILDGVTLQKLKSLGIVCEERQTGRIIPSKEMGSLLLFMDEAASLFPESKSASALEAYVRECDWMPSFLRNRMGWEQVFRQGTYVQTFLNMDPQDWEDHPAGKFCSSLLFNEQNVNDLKVLLEKLGKGPWSISDGSKWLHSPRDLLGALDLGCRATLLLPSWDDELGMCFEASQSFELHPQKQLEPFTLRPCQVVHSQDQEHLLYNLRELILLVLEEPQKLHREEMRLFSKTIKNLITKFRMPPSWLSSISPHIDNSESWVTDLVNTGEKLGLLEIQFDLPGHSEDSSFLVSKPCGRDFLLGDYDFQNTLLRKLYNVRILSKESYFGHDFPWEDAKRITPAVLFEWFNGFIALLSELPQGEFFACRDLIKAWKERSPIRAWYFQEHRRDRVSVKSEAMLNKKDYSFLMELVQVAFQTGALRLGVDEVGRYAIATTADTFWWLSGRGTLSHSPLETNSIIIKPDFEIAFLQMSPKTEALLFPFCDRLRTDSLGLMFKVTKASVQRAARLGMSLAQIEKVLASCFTKIPQNVHSEIRDWYGAVECVGWMHANLIICPNEELAQKIQGMIPNMVRILYGPILHVQEGVLRKNIDKVMKKEGIQLR